MASKAVIFGVDFTGPHILVVTIVMEYSSAATVPDDYYAILGVSRNSDQNAIRKLGLAKHPDHNNNPNAPADFQRIHA